MMNVLPTVVEMPTIRKTVAGTPVLSNMLTTKGFSNLLDKQLNHQNSSTEATQEITADDQLENMKEMLENGTITWEQLIENLEIVTDGDEEKFLFMGTELTVTEVQAILQIATNAQNLTDVLTDPQVDKLEELASAIDKKTEEVQSVNDFTQQSQWIMWLQEIQALMEKVTIGNASFKDMKQILALLKEWPHQNSLLHQMLAETNQMNEKQNKLWLQLVENYQRRESLPAQYQKPITTGDIEKWIRHAMQNMEFTGASIERADISTTLTQTAQPKLAQYVIHVQQTESNSLEKQLVNEFRQIINDSKFLTLRNGMNQLSIRLKPEHLGDVVVRLTEMNGEMTVRMIVQSQAAKDLLDKNMNQLKHLFAPHQVTVEKQDNLLSNHVTKFQEDLNREQQQENQHQEEQLTRDSETNEEESMTFEEVLMDQKV